MPVSLHCCWLSSTVVQVLTADRISRSTRPARFEVVSRRWRAGSSHAALHFLRLRHTRGARRVHAWDDLSVKRCGDIGVNAAFSSRVAARPGVGMLSGCPATDGIRLSTHRSGCRGCLDDLKGFAENFSVAEVFTLKTGAIGGSDYGFERDVIG